MREGIFLIIADLLFSSFVLDVIDCTSWNWSAGVKSVDLIENAPAFIYIYIYIYTYLLIPVEPV